MKCCYLCGCVVRSCHDSAGNMTLDARITFFGPAYLKSEKQGDYTHDRTHAWVHEECLEKAQRLLMCGRLDRVLIG